MVLHFTDWIIAPIMYHFCLNVTYFFKSENSLAIITFDCILNWPGALNEECQRLLFLPLFLHFLLFFFFIILLSKPKAWYLSFFRNFNGCLQKLHYLCRVFLLSWTWNCVGKMQVIPIRDEFSYGLFSLLMFFFITLSFSVSRKKFNLLLDFIPAAILVFFFFLTGFIQSGLIISSSSFVSLNGLSLSAIASPDWALQVVHPSPLAPHTKIYQYNCTADLNISLWESGFWSRKEVGRISELEWLLYLKILLQANELVNIQAFGELKPNIKWRLHLC